MLNEKLSALHYSGGPFYLHIAETLSFPLCNYLQGKVIISRNRRKTGGGKWEVFLRSLWGFGVSLFRLSTHGMVPHQRRVSQLFQTVLGSWTPAKCAPIRAAQQAAAVKVEVGLAPSIHVVSCCFRLVMIAPGAWLKTCWRSWCYSGPGEAASLLGQLTAKGIEAVWKWEEEEVAVCRIIM